MSPTRVFGVARLQRAELMKFTVQADESGALKFSKPAVGNAGDVIDVYDKHDAP